MASAAVDTEAQSPPSQRTMLQRVTDPDPDTGRKEAARRTMAAAILRHAPEGPPLRPSALPAVTLIRNSSASGPMCGTYEPGVGIRIGYALQHGASAG